MMRLIKRFCALILCLAMVWNFFPHQVLATELSDEESKHVKELRFYPDSESDEYILVGGKHALNFNVSTNPYHFEIEFVNPDLIGHAFVSSTVDNNKSILDAHYDEQKGLFVTEGYFEPGGENYIPDDIHVEYTLKTYAPAVGSDVDWNEMNSLLSEDLLDSTVTNVLSGENAYGTVQFSSGVQGLENVAMDYAIDSIVDSTAVGQIRSEYMSAEKVLSYVVPGMDDSRYYAHLDISDPNTLKLMIDDGLDVGGKAIELTMSFMDESNMEEQALREISESLSDAGTAVGVVGDMYNIHREMDGLRDQVASADYITDKSAAFEAIDNLEADQVAFALIVTMIPIIVTGGIATGPAAAMFTSIIGVMSTASDVVYEQRIATIMEKPSASVADWGSYTLHGGANGGFFWELYPEYNTLRIWYSGPDAGDGKLGTSESLQYYDNRDQVKDIVHRIVIEDGAVGLARNSIYEFDALEEIELPNTLRTISHQAIYACKALEDIDVPDGVTTISAGAFSHCQNLKSISLPVSVTEVGEIVANCPQLTDIYYAGNADQWDQILGHQRLENKEFTVHLKYPGGVWGDGFAWYFDEGTGTLTITGSGDMSKLPQEDIFSDVIYPWHFFDGKINRVVISEGITSIPKQAFQNHTELVEVVLPQSLNSIDVNAFENCTGLKGITLPEGLTLIGDYAFAGTGLTEIYVPESVNDLGSYLFSGCADLKTVKIDATYEQVPAGCFENCTSLTSVELADAVTWINIGAFSGCTALKNITFPAEIISISADAFKDCTGLESVTIGAKLEEMCDAFQGCTNLKDIYYGSSPAAWNAIESNGTLVEPVVSATKHYISEGYCGKEIEWDFEEITGILRIAGTGDMYNYGPNYYKDAPWSDYLDEIVEVVWEGNITSIGEYAFDGLKDIAKIVIPGTVTSIGQFAFNEVGLEELKIPQSVTYIGGAAFSGNKMTDLVIPDSVLTVEYGAFSECANLENVVIGNGLSKISNGMFREDSALVNITISASVVEIGDSAFYGTGLTSLTIPEGVTTIGYGAFAWCKELETIHIPSSISELGDLAFYNCDNLKKVYFAGDAPCFGEETFSDVTALAYYPGENATWTADVCKNYGGKITWLDNAQSCEHIETSIPGKEATCTATGLTEGKQCSVCGEILVAQKMIAAKDHTYANDQDTTCNVCGFTREVAGPEHTHSYLSSVTAPTCNEQGYTTYTCACGSTYKDNYTEAMGHQMPDGFCVRCGYLKVLSGSDSSWVYDSAEPLVIRIDAEPEDLRNVYLNGNLVDSANYSVTRGSTVITFMPAFLNKLPAGSYDVSVEFTDGVVKTSLEITKEHEHSWKAATCSEPKTCATCGATSGYALGHDWTAGSCTTPKTCKVCGLKDGGVVHAYDSQYDYKCNACGEIRTVDMTRPMVDMFRMYDPNSGEHFYTGSEVEKNNLIAAGWNYEGVGFTFPLTTGDPVHRLYDPVYGEHLYTMDVEEMNMLLAQGWNYEGIAFNSGFENEVPQYRLHNPNATRGAYHFTASLEERDMLISLGWEYQGIGWYSLGA